MKKYTLFFLIAVTCSALAITGYKYYSPIKTSNEEKVIAVQRTDTFAIQELISVMRQFKYAKTIDAEYTTTLIGLNGEKYASFEGRYMKDSLNFYLKTIGSENLINKQFFIAIDHTQKMVFIEKPEIDNISNFLEIGFLNDLDSLINLPDSIVYFQSLGNDIGKLTIEWGNYQFYKTELIYNVKTKVLQKVLLFPYKEIFDETEEEGEISNQVNATELQKRLEYEKEELPEYVEINYTSIRLNEELDPKWFDSERFVKLINGKLTPTKTVKNYDIDYE